MSHSGSAWNTEMLGAQRPCESRRAWGWALPAPFWRVSSVVSGRLAAFGFLIYRTGYKHLDSFQCHGVFLTATSPDCPLAEHMARCHHCSLVPRHLFSSPSAGNRLPVLILHISSQARLCLIKPYIPEGRNMLLLLRLWPSYVVWSQAECSNSGLWKDERDPREPPWEPAACASLGQAGSAAFCFDLCRWPSAGASVD